MLKPASTFSATRCPVALHSDRFPEAPTVRCVLGDLHSGRCKLIGGEPLTEDAHAPDERYVLMGLAVPPHVREAMVRPPWGGRGDRSAAATRPPAPRWHDGDATIAVFIVVSLAWIVSMGVLGAKALGWIR